MHLKITKISMRDGEVVVFYGSANATKQSRSNDESVLRMTGSTLTASIIKRLDTCFARVVK